MELFITFNVSVNLSNDRVLQIRNSIGSIYFNFTDFNKLMRIKMLEVQKMEVSFPEMKSFCLV